MKLFYTIRYGLYLIRHFFHIFFNMYRSMNDYCTPPEPIGFGLAIDLAYGIALQSYFRDIKRYWRIGYSHFRDALRGEKWLSESK